MAGVWFLPVKGPAEDMPSVDTQKPKQKPLASPLAQACAAAVCIIPQVSAVIENRVFAGGKGGAVGGGGFLATG